MVRRSGSLFPWVLPFQQAFGAMGRAQTRAIRTAADRRSAPQGAGDWISGIAMAPGGLRRFQLYQPADIRPFERLPLLVMLHGCQQDARAFAVSTRMNALAARERFLVLYPEQDRRANGQGCWNWYETRSGVAQAEAGIVLAAVQQVCGLYRADPDRVAIAGLSAGASLAALVATRHPERFKAVAMHSGVAPGTASSSATALRAMRGAHGPATLPESGAVPWPPLLVIHGGMDRVVSSRNAESTVQMWADAAGADASAAREVRRGQRHPMTVTDWKVARRTVATLCEVPSLGHAWSGGAARRPFSDAKGPDASRLVWSFAARQFTRATG